MTRHTISKTFTSESDGSNLAASAAWQRNSRVDTPNRMPRAARHHVNQKAPSVASFVLFTRREVNAENRWREVCLSLLPECLWQAQAAIRQPPLTLRNAVVKIAPDWVIGLPCTLNVMVAGTTTYALSPVTLLCNGSPNVTNFPSINTSRYQSCVAVGPCHTCGVSETRRHCLQRCPLTFYLTGPVRKIQSCTSSSSYSPLISLLSHALSTGIFGDASNPGGALCTAYHAVQPNRPS